MLLKQLIEETALDFEYKFNYGAEHWQNLLDEANDQNEDFEDRQKLVLLLWQDEDDILNGYSGHEHSICDGEFLFVVRSKISDESYDTKYEDAIKYLYSIADTFREALVNCNGVTVMKYKKIEVSNVYDTNFDGLKIQVKIKIVPYEN